METDRGAADRCGRAVRRRLFCLHLFLSIAIGNSALLSACAGEPVPTTTSRPADATVIGVVYGQFRQGGQPLAGARYRYWAHKPECRTPDTESLLSIADGEGRYRQSLQYFGTPGAGCLTIRLYHSAQGKPDSTQRAGVTLESKRGGPGVTPDSVRFDIDVP